MREGGRKKRKEKKKSTHPVITATKPANQGEQDQSSSHAIYPSAGERDTVTSDHQTWGNAAQTHVNQRLGEGVSGVSSGPPRSRRRKPSLERTSEEEDLLTQHLEERCQKGNEVSGKKGESKRVNTEWGGDAFTVNMLCESTALWNKEHFRRADTRNKSRFKGHPRGRKRECIRASVRGWRY